MKIRGQNISMVRGDTENIIISCTEDDITKPFVSGDIIYFTVKINTNTVDKILQKVITEFIEGKAMVEIEPNDTKKLSFMTYVYDVQWTHVDGKVTTIIPTSNFIIESEVTYE